MTLFDIPLHASLVHFPIVLLSLGGMTLLISLWRPGWWGDWGFASLLAGLVFTVPAVVSGLIDKSLLPIDSAANRLADLHTTGMVLMWPLFGAAAFLRYIWRDKLAAADKKARVALLLILGLIFLIWAGHLGARLVYEMGVGVGDAL
ncbi:MAG: DUF2231 domain-containing protein [Caldilineales bacterium]|nr:DUF2231 domain-containing protein [Caldilineales bacterium]